LLSPVMPETGAPGKHSLAALEQKKAALMFSVE
jgi:hypothetical protein